MPKAISLRQIEPPLVDIKATAEFILQVQKPSGEIPWSKGGKTDLWDHVESAMGLTVGGFHQAAKRAYLWTLKMQQADGSWWSYYRDAEPVADAYKDSNMTAYIAVGVFHYYLVTTDEEFLIRMWPTVRKAIDFVLNMQGPGGEVYWAQRGDGSVEQRALLTGSSSIYLSLKCALHIAALLGQKKTAWEEAGFKLGRAIRYKPFLFDQSKARFSMDWYYPILCGAISGKAAEKRIERQWPLFTIPGWGIKCVSDQPWLTMAETAEFVLALAAMGEFETALRVYAWIYDKKYADGAFWTGVTYPDRVIYTEEKTAWTGAAVLLAADILYDLTQASGLFAHDFREPPRDSGQSLLSPARLKATVRN